MKHPKIFNTLPPESFSMRSEESGHPKTGSKLDPYWHEIAGLRRRGCTLAGLREALASKNVEVSISRLCTYIHHREDEEKKACATSPAAQGRLPHREVDEDPLAMLLLRQIKAQAERIVFSPGLDKEKS